MIIYILTQIFLFPFLMLIIISCSERFFKMKWEECYLTTFYLLFQWGHPPGFVLSMKQSQAFSLTFTPSHLHCEVKKKKKVHKDSEYRLIWLFHSHQGSRILLFFQTPSSLAGDFHALGLPHGPVWLPGLQPSHSYSREEARSKRPLSCLPSYKGCFFKVLYWHSLSHC